MIRVAVIGGGAAGMTAAILLGRRGADVVLFEKNERVGKKLLSTGNGRCNLGNTASPVGRYNSDFPLANLERYGLKAVTAFFGSLGVLTREEEGRIYPYSGEAATVLNALREGLIQSGVEVLTSSEVKAIGKIAKGYEVCGSDFDCVILACGSVAGAGADSIYLYERFGHTSKPRVPALAPVITDRENLKGLRGVRVTARVSLFVGARLAAESTGDVLFKDTGISGTAVFDVSSALARLGGENATIYLDLMPEYSESEAAAVLAATPLEGIFHKELAANIKKLGGGVSAVKRYPLHGVIAAPVSLAQVMSGGLETAYFNRDTLESKLSAGLFAAGEALDVDGACGGWNLMWAFSSAIAVADAISG